MVTAEPKCGAALLHEHHWVILLPGSRLEALSAWLVLPTFTCARALTHPLCFLLWDNGCNGLLLHSLFRNVANVQQARGRKERECDEAENIDFGRTIGWAFNWRW